MRIVWIDVQDGYASAERFVEVTRDYVFIGVVGRAPERSLTRSEVCDIIAGRMQGRVVTASRDGGYAVGCMRFPTHVVNAVCKALGVARPVVTRGVQ